MFTVLPAIDLRAGRVVRLMQGDFARETVYARDPEEVAAEFVAAGALWLHVVDLDGARVGAPRQAPTIRRIIQRVGDRAAVEVAGGLRDTRSVDDSLASGAGRVVLGTAALRDREFVRGLVRWHGPDRVVVALDVRGDAVVGQAWQEGGAAGSVEDNLLRLSSEGVETFEVTAIDRDGLLGGPDLELLERLVGLRRGAIIASGGVASLRDLSAVRSIGCAGAIVGRALYEGRLDLAGAIGLSEP